MSNADGPNVMKNRHHTAATLVARTFGSAPFNWTCSRALEPEERELIAALPVRPGMRVLVVACGGAANTFYFAEAVTPGGDVSAFLPVCENEVPPREGKAP